jgi:OmpA-OmpF porin, OOP family
MKRKVGIGVSLLLSSFLAHAQADEMLAYGKVTDARTNKGVKAAIRYSSIPTGSIHGDFNDSTFSFQIFGTARYKITAEAQGYNPKTIIVDPKDMDTTRNVVVKDIKLSRSGDAVRLNHLIFAQGKSTIEPQSFPELDEIGLMMQENPKIEIQLEGHTDNVGSADANLKLSQERVDAVKSYLVKKGVKKSRIQTKAFGGSRPLKNEMTPEARVLNRRVEMRILKD